jgi:hypothetical protein
MVVNLGFVVPFGDKPQAAAPEPYIAPPAPYVAPPAPYVAPPVVLPKKQERE